MTKFAETVDSLDGVAEEYRPAYAAGADGKFTLKPEFKPFATAITGLNETLGRTDFNMKKAQKEAADRRGVLQAFEELMTAQGITVEDGKDAKEALKAHIDDLVLKAKNGGELKVNMDAIRKDFEKKAKELTDLADGKISVMSKSLEKYLVGQQANAALAKAKGSVDLLLPIVRSQVKVVQDGEDYVVRVVDPKTGDVRTDGKGGFLDIEGLVAEMKLNTTYARAFESETKGGGGAQQQKNNSQTRTVTDRDKMTPTQKIAAGLTKGQVEHGLGRQK
jgi:hypothetical protein